MTDSLEDLAKSFSRDLRAEGRSVRTSEIYCAGIRFFGEWLVADGRSPTLDQLTRPAIRAWLAHLAERGLEPSTIRTRFSALRRFCRWLVAEGELAESPMAGMAAPVPRLKPVPIISDEHLAALLRTCAGKGFDDRRDEAMFRVLLDCGLRASELSGMNVADLDLDHDVALVTGKGSRVRPVYLAARTIRSLDRYLRVRRTHRLAHLDALWLGQRGRLGPYGVQERLDVRTTEAGLGHIHIHQFRHTHAHDFLISGGQEHDLKRIMGWSSDVMLERYGRSAADARAEAATRRMKRGDRV